MLLRERAAGRMLHASGGVKAGGDGLWRGRQRDKTDLRRARGAGSDDVDFWSRHFRTVGANCRLKRECVRTP